MAKKKRRNPLPLLDLLEEMFEESRDRSVPPQYPYDQTTDTIELPKKVEKRLRRLVLAGNKVEAVKQVTRLTGAGLRVSKDYVDSLVTSPSGASRWRGKPKRKR